MDREDGKKCALMLGDVTKVDFLVEGILSTKFEHPKWLEEGRGEFDHSKCLVHRCIVISIHPTTPGSWIWLHCIPREVEHPCDAVLEDDVEVADIRFSRAIQCPDLPHKSGAKSQIIGTKSYHYVVYFTYI